MAEAWPTDPGEGPSTGRGHACAPAKAGRRRLARRSHKPSLFPSRPFAAAFGGKRRQTPVAFEPCGVFRPHAGKLGLAGFSHVGMAGLEPGSTVVETTALAIAPPTQREASMNDAATPGRPVLRTAGVADASREPRAGFEPATCRLRGGCATTGPSGLDGPSHRFFQCMMRVCPHGCLVGRATGGTVWWSRRDSDPRPSRCERDALPLRHGPMPVPAYAGTGWKRSHSGGGITPLAPSAGFEPATPTLGGWRSIP